MTKIRSSSGRLQSLLNRRLSNLTRQLVHPARGKSGGSAPERASTVALDTLAKLIQKQIVAELPAILGGGAPGRKGTPQMPGGFAGAAYPQAGGFDNRHMESQIDQMVAASLMHGRQTSGVLRALFGLVPSLIGR